MANVDQPVISGLPVLQVLRLPFCRLAHSSAGLITGVLRKSHPVIEAFSTTGKQVKVSSLMA
jgi:hypothetical protein